MNNDLISREALKKAIDDAYREYDGYDPQDLMRFAERVDTEIDNAPTVESAEKPSSRKDLRDSFENGFKSGTLALAAELGLDPEIVASFLKDKEHRINFENIPEPARTQYMQILTGVELKVPENDASDNLSLL